MCMLKWRNGVTVHVMAGLQWWTVTFAVCAKENVMEVVTDMQQEAISITDCCAGDGVMSWVVSCSCNGDQHILI